MMRSDWRHGLILLVSLGLTQGVLAHEGEHQEQSSEYQRSGAKGQEQGAFEISGAWARATIGKSRISAAYLKIEKQRGGADKLVAISSPLAGKVELHTSLMKNGMMMMRQIDSLEVAPGRPALFQPGGNHIMLLDLKKPLRAGEQLPLKLYFKNSAPITVQVRVKGLTESMGGDQGPMTHKGHAQMGHEHASDEQESEEHEHEQGSEGRESEYR